LTRVEAKLSAGSSDDNGFSGFMKYGPFQYRYPSAMAVSPASSHKRNHREEAEETLRDKAPAREHRKRPRRRKTLHLRPRRPAAPQGEGDHEAQDAKRKVNEVVRHAITVGE